MTFPFALQIRVYTDWHTFAKFTNKSLADMACEYWSKTFPEEEYRVVQELA